MGPLYYFQNNEFILSRNTNKSDLTVEHSSGKALGVKRLNNVRLMGTVWEFSRYFRKLNIRFQTWLGHDMQVNIMDITRKQC